jgi:prevent-host-death family protein
MNVVNVHDFKTHYSKYLKLVKKGEKVIVGERGKPIAELRPLSISAMKPRQPGLWKGKAWIADDFDEPMMELWEQIANR